MFSLVHAHRVPLSLVAYQVGAVDCSKAERFCSQKDVLDLPTLSIAIDGELSEFGGATGVFISSREI